MYELVVNNNSCYREKKGPKSVQELSNTKVFMSLPRPSIETFKARVMLQKLEDKWEERNENSKKSMTEKKRDIRWCLRERVARIYVLYSYIFFTLSL